MLRIGDVLHRLVVSRALAISSIPSWKNKKHEANTVGGRIAREVDERGKEETCGLSPPRHLRGRRLPGDGALGGRAN